MEMCRWNGVEEGEAREDEGLQDERATSGRLAIALCSGSNGNEVGVQVQRPVYPADPECAEHDLDEGDDQQAQHDDWSVRCEGRDERPPLVALERFDGLRRDPHGLR